MANRIITVDKTNKVICIGDIISCKKYINQLYSISLDNVDFILINEDNYIYEDYELVYVKDYNVYLTMGEVNLLQNTCRDEQGSIKFIEKELEKLSNLDVFSNKIKYKIDDMLDTLNEMKKEHQKYLNENLFYNLDIDALRNSLEYERENKGETIYYFDKKSK